MGEGSSKLARLSNMELLRIVAMFLIVLFHCAYKSGFEFESFTLNNYVIKIFWMFGELGVNLFVLVSGYFLVSRHFKGEKLIRLVCQVLFYWLASVAIAVNLGIFEIQNIRSFILIFMPIANNQYWFATAYIVLYIFTPWINPFLRSE